MTDYNDIDVSDATDEQIELLRELGASESDLDGLTAEDADTLISELRAQREDAGRVGLD